jgi:SNF2 family DNA or RNA helicase
LLRSVIPVPDIGLAISDSPYARLLRLLIETELSTHPWPRSRLRRYQTFTVELIKRVWRGEIPGIILAYDMGSGKTASTLTAIVDLLDAGLIKRPLIVAPKLVAETVWPDEIEKWEHTEHLTYSILVGTEKQRAEAAQSPADIHIINKDVLPWLWDFFGRGKKWPYDAVIIDEASMLKNGKKRTKLKKLTRFGTLAAARKFMSGVIELTGTPAPNGMQNLWGLAYIVDQGERLGRSKGGVDGFMTRWFDVNQYTHEVTAKPFATDEIMSRLKDIMFSLDPADLDELPETVSVIRKVRLTDKEMREYKRFKRTLVSEEYDVEAANAAVLSNKLLQFANGSMYQEDGNDVWVHDRKLDALAEIHEEADGKPLLVAYSFKFDLERIRKKFPKAIVLNEVPDVRQTVKDWNAGKIDMLLAHPASAGHGINAQYGSNIAVWYGLTPDLELYQQFNKRLVRPGQTESHVFLHHIIAECTHDENMLPLLADKQVTQDRVLAAVMVELNSE